LINEIGYKTLNIILMMTPDDKSNDGKTHPSQYSSSKEISEYCQRLRRGRKLELLYELPLATTSEYEVVLHKPNAFISSKHRKEYFSDISTKTDQVILF